MTAAKKTRTRYEGREDGRQRLQNQIDPLPGEIIRAGIQRFLPEGLDLRSTSPEQSDMAQGMLAGLLTYNWPSIRLSNSGVDTSWAQAKQAARDVAHESTKAGLPFNEEEAVQNFIKGHAFRASDLRICVVRDDGSEKWMDPISWSQRDGLWTSVPDMVTLAVMSTKKNQNGNRPDPKTAKASGGMAARAICRGIGAVVLAANYGSLQDLLFSRLAESWNSPKGARRNLMTATIGVVAKAIAKEGGLNEAFTSGNSFKKGGATAAAARPGAPR